jgi:hypothetical protein
LAGHFSNFFPKFSRFPAGATAFSPKAEKQTKKGAAKEKNYSQNGLRTTGEMV